MTDTDKAFFTGPMDVRYNDQWKQGRRVRTILNTFGFTCYLDGNRKSVVVRRGFKTDFASVPPVVRKFIPPSGRYAQAAVVHDYLYLNKIGDRETADRIFLEAMKVAGVRWYTRSIMFRSVRMFGNNGWGR